MTPRAARIVAVLLGSSGGFYVTSLTSFALAAAGARFSWLAAGALIALPPAVGSVVGYRLASRS